MVLTIKNRLNYKQLTQFVALVVFFFSVWANAGLTCRSLFVRQERAVPARQDIASEGQLANLATELISLFREDMRAANVNITPSIHWYEQGVLLHLRRPTTQRGVSYHEIVISRGAVLRAGGDKFTLAMQLLHEIGHILGRGPRDQEGFYAEGEADYFSTSEGLRRWLRSGELPVVNDGPVYRNAAAYLHAQGYTSTQIARLAPILVYAHQAIQSAYPDANLSFSARDNSVVQTTSMTYPPPQARLDTLIAGLLGRARPQSWARPQDF